MEFIYDTNIGKQVVIPGESIVTRNILYNLRGNWQGLI